MKSLSQRLSAGFTIAGQTDEAAEQHLVPRFEFKPLDLISIRNGEQFKSERRFQAEAATVIKELRIWQALMNRAVALKVISQNPIVAVKAPRDPDSKPHRFYAADELLALYAACRVKVNNGEGPQPGPVRAGIWKFYANKGMRRMGVCT